jgi:hypothetical protein
MKAAQHRRQSVVRPYSAQGDHPVVDLLRGVRQDKLDLPNLSLFQPIIIFYYLFDVNAPLQKKTLSQLVVQDAGENEEDEKRNLHRRLEVGKNYQTEK